MRLDRTTIMWIVLVLLILYAWQCGVKSHGNFTGLEYMPDMAHSRAYDVYYPSPGAGSDIEKESGDQQVEQVFADGKVARQPVSGTVARGYIPYPYADTPEGYEESASLINPYAYACSDDLEEGKRLYTVYCGVCHGAAGKGKGKISATNNGPLAGVPNYMAAAYLQMEEGKMFHSIQWGKNNMGSYASQLNKEERWKVVAYIKDLQAKYAKGDQKLDSDAAALAFVRGSVGGVMPRKTLGVTPPDCVAKEEALEKQKATIDARLKAAQEAAKHNAHHGHSHGHDDGHHDYGHSHDKKHNDHHSKKGSHGHNDHSDEKKGVLGAVADASKSFVEKSVVTFKDAVKAGKSFVTGDQIVLENVTFNTGSDVIKPSSFDELDNVIKILGDNADMKLNITGHTDSKGNATLNQRLSENRARAVFTYLVANGVDKARLKFKGLGAKSPVGNNATEEGRAKNRRIEFEVL